MRAHPTTIKNTVLSTFLIMVIVNALANILPINGLTTRQVSESYPNLFTPAPVTFAIWGVIYLLLAAYTLYQLGYFQDFYARPRVALNEKVGILFSISSLANAAWIFAWHYHKIPLTMILMVVILLCLLSINHTLSEEKLTTREKYFIRLPFSVYFGWITVATIANATVLLVSRGWNGWGLSEPGWAIIIIVVGMLIGAATTIRYRDIVYGFVLIWAYTGILIRYESETGYAGQYRGVTATVLICLALFLAAIFYVFKLTERRKAMRHWIDGI